MFGLETILALLCSGLCCLGVAALILVGVMVALRSSGTAGAEVPQVASSLPDPGLAPRAVVPAGPVSGAPEAASPGGGFQTVVPPPTDDAPTEVGTDAGEPDLFDEEDMATVVAPPPSVRDVPKEPPPPPPAPPPPSPKKGISRSSGQTIIAFDDDDDDW